MLALRSQMAGALLAVDNLTAALNVVPQTNDPAIYLRHVADIETIWWPALSLFSVGGPDEQLKFAEDVSVQLDIWTEEPPSTPVRGRAYGLAGAELVYRLARSVLHMAHLRGTLNKPGAFTVPQCEEVARAQQYSYETPRRLHHYSTAYRVRVVPVGAEFVFPNA